MYETTTWYKVGKSGVYDLVAVRTHLFVVSHSYHLGLHYTPQKKGH